jgi:hypothetical protein
MLMYIVDGNVEVNVAWTQNDKSDRVDKRMNYKLLPIIAAAFLTLLVTFSPVPYEIHIVARYCICFAALYTFISAWKTLSKIDTVVLVAILIIYNPILLVQLGSALAWAVIGFLTGLYFSIRLFKTDGAIKNVQ